MAKKAATKAKPPKKAAAKKPAAKKAATTNASAPPEKQRGRNTMDPAQAKFFQREVDKCYAELLELQTSYMGKARTVRDRLGKILDRADAAGYPKKVVRNDAEARKLAKRIADLLSPADDETGEFTEQMDMFREATGQSTVAERLGDEGQSIIDERARNRSEAMKQAGRGMPGADPDQTDIEGVAEAIGDAGQDDDEAESDAAEPMVGTEEGEDEAPEPGEEEFPMNGGPEPGETTEGDESFSGEEEDASP